MGDEFSAQGDGEGAGGEGAYGDRVFEDGEGSAKSFVLPGGVAHEEGEAGGRVLGGGQKGVSD